MSSESEELGKARQDAHPFGTPRYYDDPNSEDILGMKGELAFESRYGLKADRSIRPDGDGHVDFITTVDGKRLTIDVKTARKPYHLLIKDHEINCCADINVLAGVNPETEEIQFLGWASKDQMKECPRKFFSSLRILNYYKKVSDLNPMSELDLILGAKNDQK